jgi:hypothetical protein
MGGMSTIADGDDLRVVAGVDTHKDLHVARAERATDRVGVLATGLTSIGFVGRAGREARQGCIRGT